jgi:single-strand DNA-binding protein
MHDTLITLQGNVGGDVRIRTAGDSEVATFRVACTPRRWSRRDQAWFDAPTQWYSVSCWRALAHHVEQSLHRGDPVVVHGRLTQNTWTNSDGVDVVTDEVEALFVGHDLNRGTTAFTKRARSGHADVAGAETPTPVAAPVEATAPLGSAAA